MVLLLLGFGAGLATGLARFPDPRLLVCALLPVGWLLRHQATPSLICAALFLGQLSAFGAWQGEPRRCAARSRPMRG